MFKKKHGVFVRMHIRAKKQGSTHDSAGVLPSVGRYAWDTNVQHGYFVIMKLSIVFYSLR